MLYSSSQKIEDITVFCLAKKGPQSTQELFELVKIEKKVTLQGFYKVLRKLLEDEIIVKYKNTLSLNTVWVNSLIGLFHGYLLDRPADSSNPLYAQNILNLQEGDKIVCTFKTTHHLDVFWTHLITHLLAKTRHPELLLYNCHSWFFFVREEAEKNMFGWLASHKIRTYMAMGGDTISDNIVRDYVTGPYTQVAGGARLGIADNVHPTIIDSFIIRTVYTPNFSAEVKKVFKNSTSAAMTRKGLQEALRKFPRCKIIVVRSEKEAATYRKKFKKYFHLPAQNA